MISRYEDIGGAGLGRGRFEGLYSLHEAAERWGLDDSTVRKAIASGRFIVGLDCMKFGKQWVVTHDAMSREFNVRRMLRETSAKFSAERERVRRMREIEEGWPE